MGEINDYGDILRSGRDRGYIIEQIYEMFEVDADDIERAASAARVGYPNEPIQYFFLANCIYDGRNLKEDYDLESEMGAEVMDAVREAADSAVPYQTYMVWRLWIEFGFETDAYSDFGLEPSLSNLENVAQVQLMSYAESIIYTFGDE